MNLHAHSDAYLKRYGTILFFEKGVFCNTVDHKQLKKQVFINY